NPAPAGLAITVAHPLQTGLAGRFSIYSFDGRLVATVAAAPGSTATPLPISQLAAGNYLLVYEAAPGAPRLSTKFVKTE
ncbi:MAG: T9SS type A sorting domain-containing protein, partial [Janthinobacterium lividum]